MATKAQLSQLRLYTWTGKDEQGKFIKGEIEGISLPAVKASLRNQKISPIKVRKKTKPFWSRKKKIKTKDISIFTRQLATMLTSGIPLMQTLNIVSKGHPNPSMEQLIQKIKADVEEGKPLNEALKKYPRYFNELYCSLVHAGEQSGALDKILDRLATYKEKTESIKGKIRKALFYPAAIIVVAMIVTTAILIFVIPQFQELFKSFGAQLPFLTQAVINLSQFVINYWWILLGILIISVFVFLYALKRVPRFTQTIDRIMLKLPILGIIIKKAAVARFASTLATTFAAGIPLVEALESVAKATGNVVFNNATLQISNDISRGQQLQAAVRNSQVFPEMVVQMIGIGEESGELEGMLTKVADFYQEEVDNAVDGLSTLIEPIIMAFLGIIIGGLIVAMYLPIFKLGSVV